MSSMSTSSSSTCEVEKKLVGGICFGSPTTTSALPRATAPTASLVGICEASSKITISNFSRATSTYCATDMGLISIHGQSLGSKVGMLSIIERMELPRPPFIMLRLRIPSSEVAMAASSVVGTRDTMRQ